MQTNIRVQYVDICLNTSVNHFFNVINRIQTTMHISYKIKNILLDIRKYQEFE